MQQAVFFFWGFLRILDFSLVVSVERFGNLVWILFFGSVRILEAGFGTGGLFGFDMLRKHKRRCYSFTVPENLASSDAFPGRICTIGISLLQNQVLSDSSSASKVSGSRDFSLFPLMDQNMLHLILPRHLPSDRHCHWQPLLLIFSPLTLKMVKLHFPRIIRPLCVISAAYSRFLRMLAFPLGAS